MNTWKWWKAALIRAVRTFAQAALAVLPATALITSVDWREVVLTAAYAFVLSLLMSMATGLPEADNTPAPASEAVVKAEEEEDGTTE